MHKLLYIYGSNLLNGILGVILIRFMTNKLGFSGYGLYSIYLIMLSYLMLLDSGISRNLVLAIIEKGDLKKVFNSHYSAFAIISLSLVLLFYPLALLFGKAFGYSLRDSHLVLISVVVCLEFFGNSFITIRQSFEIANQNFLSIAKFNMFSGLGRYLIIFSLLILNHDAIWIISSMIIKKGIENFIAFKLYNLPIHFSDIELSLHDGLGIIRSGAKITFAQVGQTALITIPAIVASRNLGFEGLGIFRAIFDLASRVWFISNGFGLVIFPIFTKMRLNLSARMVNSFKEISLLSVTFYLSILIVGILISPFLLSFIHLKENSMTLMTLILIGMLMNAHSNTMYEMIQSFRKPLLLGVCSVVACLPYIFVWRGAAFDIEHIGAMWLLSQVLYLILMDMIFIRFVGISQSSLQKLFATLAFISTGLVLFFYKDKWFLYSLFILCVIFAGKKIYRLRFETLLEAKI